MIKAPLVTSYFGPKNAQPHQSCWICFVYPILTLRVIAFYEAMVHQSCILAAALLVMVHSVAVLAADADCPNIPASKPDVCLAQGCQYCLLTEDKQDTHCFGVKDPYGPSQSEGNAVFHQKQAAGVAMFCSTNREELDFRAFQLQRFLASRQITVDNPKEYTRMFAGRFQVIVGKRMFEFSTGTSGTPKHNRPGMWWISTGYVINKQIAAQACARITPSVYDQFFISPGAIMKGDDMDKDVKDLQAKYAVDSEPFITIGRFDSILQLYQSMHLTKKCKEIFHNVGLPERWMTHILASCMKAQQYWDNINLPDKFHPKLRAQASEEVEKAVAGKYMRVRNAVQANTVAQAHSVILPDISGTELWNTTFRGCDFRPGSKANPYVPLTTVPVGNTGLLTPLAAPTAANNNNNNNNNNVNNIINNNSFKKMD